MLYLLMDNIYETILSNNIYLAIVGLLLVVIVFSIVKKLFKLAVIVLICCGLWVGYIMISEDKDFDEAMDTMEEQLDEALEQGKEVFEESEKKIEDALKLIP